MAKEKIYNVLLDTMASVQNPSFSINTNDLKTVKLSILINQDGDPLDLTDATVRLAVKKPDRKTVLQDVTIVDPVAGSCEIVLDTQAYVVDGSYTAEVMVYYTTDTVSVTSGFTYTAKKGILSDDTIESTNEWQSITQAIADNEAILEDLRTNGTGVDAQARADIATHTTQLAEIPNQAYITDKATKTELNAVASGSPKGVYTTVTDLQNAFPTGNTNIYLVLGNVKEVDTLSVTASPTSAGNVTVTLNGVAANVAVTSGVAEVSSLTVSAVPTTTGNVTVTLNGVATTISLDPATDTTTDAVATKIRNTAFTGWTTGGTGSTVTFTATSVGIKTDATYSAGTTGATGTMSTTTQGVDADSTTSIATKIRGTSFSGWTTGGTGTTVTFTATSAGVKTTPSYSAGSTGVTGTMSVTTAGVNADGQWYYWNGSAWTAGGVYQSTVLADGSVTLDKTNFAPTDSQNTFNPYTVTNGYRLDVNGNPYADAAYSLSDFIPIVNGKTYVVQTKGNLLSRICGYNSSKGFLKVVVTPSTLYLEFTADFDGFIRVPCSTTDILLVQVVDKSIYNGFVPYQRLIPDYVKSIPKDNSVTLTKIPNSTITAEKTTFFVKGKNLFNPATRKLGVFVQEANGSEAASSLYDTSDYIPVSAGVAYSSTKCRKLVLYNSNKTFVSGYDVSSTTKTVTPTVDGYMRVSFPVGDVPTSQVEVGSTNTAYEQFGHTSDPLKGLSLVDNSTPGSKLKDNDVDGTKIKDSAISTSKVNFLIPGKNLFNKDIRTVGNYVSEVTGTLVVSANYDTSDYIPVTAGTTYAFTAVRKIVFYDANRVFVQGIDVSNNSPQTATPAQNGYMRVSFSGVNVPTSQAEVGTTQTSYEPFGLKPNYNLLLNDKIIFKRYLEQSVQDSLNNADALAASGGFQIINMANVDRIGFIGDSYTESIYSVKGKSYINKLSLFSDYNFENFAQSGDTYRGNLDRIRKKSPIYHTTLSWQDFKPKYAFLTSYTNDLKYMDNAQYANDLRAIVETVKSLGALPIIATEYHSTFGGGIQTLMRQIAREYDAEFVDIIPKVTQLRGTDYTDFWGGSHPGTRSNSLESDNHEKYLRQLPRPRQSLKVFRLRTGQTVSTLDDLVFFTNTERAKKFKEVAVGHNALTDPKYVDKVNSGAYSRVTSEYLMLQNGENVSFTDYVLISAVLPSTGLKLKTLRLLLNDTTVNVYVKNILASPYPSPTYYQRFDFTGTPTINVGDTYTSSDPAFSGTTFTVSQVNGNSILMSPYKGGTSQAGTLTKVSGSGSASISYGYTAPGFDSNYPVGKQNVGHWQQVSLSNGKFDVPASLIADCVDYDKVHFLIQKAGAFNLNNISVEWSGKEDKVYKVKDLKLEEPTGAEKLTQPFTGNSSQLSSWTVDGTVTPYVPADNNLPSGAVGCVDITTSNKVKQAFTYSNSVDDVECEIKVWARYFPAVSDPAGSTFTITEDSYDYAELAVDLIQGTQVFTMKDRVNLHWKEVTFRAYLPAGTTTQTIRVYSNDNTIQLTKVSVKQV
ncbi:SGNH/GDSL hydrolase family protein [Bacillus sp. ISL-7]|uniref:SGNH/GDSL hydrolase family protein n=1 Tax=Bacillus sp. ISL-7 TaxID=2819136 RepID=UPI001BE7F9A7|nr:SGNH/GDSL hydrolase family protein [Bacillus sp. ISL-7]MBT2735129.1 BppU family phage baseplate upper protein [Bacillus sp. ISL-7]